MLVCLCEILYFDSVAVGSPVLENRPATMCASNQNLDIRFKVTFLDLKVAATNFLVPQ